MGINLVPKGLQFCLDRPKFRLLGPSAFFFDLFFFGDVIEDALNAEDPSQIILVCPGINGPCSLKSIPPVEDDFKIFNCPLCLEQLQ